MSATTLQRETFQLSRTLEFFSEKELTAQMGFSRHDWPIALLKELLDNALDACESAGIAPVIAVDLEDDALTVTDNGPGLPLDVLRQSLDYTIRVSDKNGYVSPSRGQQGNALKTLWAAPFAATGEGRIEVQTADYSVEVRVSLDRIAQTPRLELVESEGSNVKTGTRVTLHWRGIAGYLKREYLPDFYSVVYGLIDFNPHCDLWIDGKQFEATDPEWTHWLPNQPTSPHWYQQESFRHLISLLLNAERRGGKARSINEFVREFHGLTGTAKAKAIAHQAWLTGAMLHDLIVGDDVDAGKVTALLNAMQDEARPVKADALGLLGKDHCERQAIGYGATADSVEHRRVVGDVGGLPYVLEVAFGVKQQSRARTLSIGINFSPALSQPFYALDTALNEARCTRTDPVVMLVHLACPAVQFSDRGKSKALLPRAIAADLQRLVKQVTARFTKAKRQADRNDRMNERNLEELRNAHKVKPMSVKAAAYQVMESSYMKASSNNTLPANARQIMYAARPLIIELTGKPWSGDDYFTQTLLPDFIRNHPAICENWDVVFDDRGHFAEPHTGKRIGIGTLAVRRYVNGWHGVIQQNIERIAIADHLATTGPALRYRYALFIEKEGFTPLLERARIAERYDLAIMSTKGMSVTAARQLIEELSDQDVTLLVLHDFDKSGFTILHTLYNDTRRYQFKTKPNVIDLGLRLADVEALQLDSEAVEYSRDPRSSLAQSGATADEIEFLATAKEKSKELATQESSDERRIGKRVELNAMDSATFIRWLEEKLIAHGVTKFVPDADSLNAAWQRAWRITELNKAIEKAVETLPDAPEPPNDLLEQVSARLNKNPALAWDRALR